MRVRVPLSPLLSHNFLAMNQKALHDFAHNDYRLFNQLLVRLNFVKTWSARRTLAYYKVIRELTDDMDEQIHETGYFDSDGNRPNPFDPDARRMDAPRKVYTYKKFVKPEYTEQIISDFKELERYKKALNWTLSQMDDVPTKQRRKTHCTAYYIR